MGGISEWAASWVAAGEVNRSTPLLLYLASQTLYILPRKSKCFALYSGHNEVCILEIEKNENMCVEFRKTVG